MLLRDALAYANTELDKFPYKQLEARILLANILNLSQELLLIRYNQEISEDERLRFVGYIQRRKSFEPIAYITGKKEFYGLDFLVGKDVLIPRPDTETLVDEVIRVALENKLQKNCHPGPQDQGSITSPKTGSRIEDSQVSASDSCSSTSMMTNRIKILDLGTGSGAIAVSLAVNIADAFIVATDISPQGLKIAKQNAQLNDVADKIKFIESDWYSNITSEKFDFIISNPPYISADEKIYMAEETLQYEPSSALFASNKGLENYDKIIKGAGEFLKNEGKVFLEIGFNQADSVNSILEKYKFTEIKVLKDLAGQTRVITAKYLC